MAPPLDISPILPNSVYRGGWRWSPVALDLQGGGFLLRMGIWPGVDAGAAAMRGRILPPCSSPLVNLKDIQATRFSGFGAAVSCFSSAPLGWFLVANPQDGQAKQKKKLIKKNRKMALGRLVVAAVPPLTNSLVYCFGLLWVALELVVRSPYGELGPAPHVRPTFLASVQFGALRRLSFRTPREVRFQFSPVLINKADMYDLITEQYFLINRVDYYDPVSGGYLLIPPGPALNLMDFSPTED